jgi:hypothetical protein
MSISESERGRQTHLYKTKPKRRKKSTHNNIRNNTKERKKIYSTLTINETTGKRKAKKRCFGTAYAELS